MIQPLPRPPWVEVEPFAVEVDRVVKFDGVRKPPALRLMLMICLFESVKPISCRCPLRRPYFTHRPLPVSITPAG